MGEADKRKMAIIGIASILLVSVVVAVAVDITWKHGDENQNEATHKVTSSAATVQKAVEALCSPTDYRETCEESLSQANTTDTKDLIKLAFDVTIQGIHQVLNSSKLLEEATNDNSVKEALFICQDVLEVAIDDLRRSFDKIDEFDINKMNDYVNDIKTWLSAVITNQQTCIDAFDNTTTSTGDKMKSLMKTVREMSSNGLAIVTDISSAIAQLQLGGLSLATDTSPNRKLMFYGWQRRLLEASTATINAVVALDGSGQFKSINDAINSSPDRSDKPFVIYVKAGLYNEYVVVPKAKTNIILIGDGPTKTKLTGNKNFADGVKTFLTSTISVEAFDFCAKDIGFQNTAGPRKFQAVALRVSGDRAVFYNVHIDGYQDTLYTHAYRQYYKNCKISGTIDFVFGDGLSIFENCKFVVRKPLGNQACMVTAQGRVDPRSIGAIIINHGIIYAEKHFFETSPIPKAYLGRPWKELSRTIIMNTDIGGFIAPEGWAPWNGEFALDTLYYGECNNTGAGSNISGRVTWKGIRHITTEIAQRWTPKNAYGDDKWIIKSGIPYARDENQHHLHLT